MNSLKMILLLGGMALSGAAMACKCAPKGELTKEEIAETPYIFTGKVLKIEPVEGEMRNKITFRVQKGLKGFRKGEVVTVYTPISSAACGITFTEGEEWYLYLSEGHSVNMCGRAARLYRDLSVVEPQFRKDEKLQLKKQKKQVKRDRKLIRETMKEQAASVG